MSRLTFCPRCSQCSLDKCHIKLTIMKGTIMILTSLDPLELPNVMMVI